MHRYFSRALDSKMDKFADMDRIYSLDVTRVIHNSTARNIPPKYTLIKFKLKNKKKYI